MKRSEIMTLLRTAPQDVELLICRPEAGILPALPTPVQPPVPPAAATDIQPPLQHSTPRTTPASTLEHNTRPQHLHTEPENTETPSTRPHSSTSEYSSSSQSDQEDSVIQPNLVKQKIAAIEAGRLHNHLGDGDAKAETALDKEVERLNLEEPPHNPGLDRTGSPSSPREIKSTSVCSESEVDLPIASEDGHSETEENVESHVQQQATPVSHTTDAKTDTKSNERTEKTSASHTADTRSTGRSDWTSTGTGSYTGTGSFTTSYYSDEETETTLGPGEFEVTLTKGEKGLGFTVAGGQTSTGFFYVKDVLYDPALKDGRMQRGDRLLRVNSQDMTDLNHKEAIAYLRQTPATVTIRLSRSAVFMNQEEGDKGATDEAKAQETTQDTSKPTKDEQREPRAETKVTAADSGNKLDVKVHGSSPVPDEEKENARNEAGETNQEVDNRSKSRLSQTSEKDVIRINLRKPAGGNLGFSLIQGEKGTTSALFVRSLTPGGTAAADGRLRVGDRLLQVNGQSVIGMPHNKAVALIKNTNDLVILAISRSQPASGITSRPNTDRLTPSSTHYNTDSDVDSTALDEEDNPVLESAKQRQKEVMSGKSGTHRNRKSHSQERSSASEDDQSDNEEVKRYTSKGNKKLAKQGSQQVHSGDESDGSFGDEVQNIEFPGEIKEQRVQEPVTPRKPLQARLPPQVDDTWLGSLRLIDIPSGSVHYAGREMNSTIKQLRQMIEHDDPTEEYKNMRHAKLTDNSVDARLPENKSKNRYRNVLPYDATRVRLTGPENYINASHVRVPVGKQTLHYIACQGPLPQTTGDFWRMIWEQKVEVIAMVTQDMESGKVKCHRYWPDSIAAPFTVYNRYELSLRQIQRLEHFDIHHVKMEDLETGQVRRVMHCNFTSWPDHGTPSTGVPLLQYIRFLHIIQDSSPGPLVVHCSAGIGRTGALITLDVVLTMITKDLKFDIRKIVMDLRRQRQGMIQTKDQYTFCYKAVLEALELTKS